MGFGEIIYNNGLLFLGEISMPRIFFIQCLIDGGFMKYIARRNDFGQEQDLKEHLENVAILAMKFASHFDSSKIAYTIGLLHDIGKYSIAFQKRINGSNEKVDHSTAGLQLVEKTFDGFLARVMGYCISGHHGGLVNFGTEVDNGELPTLNGRLKKNIEKYDAYQKEITISKDIDLEKIKSILRKSEMPDFSLSFYIRMLYSCLVDADYLDSEAFMNPEIDRKIDYDYQIMNSKLNNYLNNFKNKKGIINEKRQEILRKCIQCSYMPRGLYRLTVPTGGGKTLSSMAFALNHLLNYNLKRIIYVIPYTSIIEQTANIFKNIFGSDKVLEHHYNYNFESDEDDDLNQEQEKLKLSTQNWDYPIIITTNVQFFESLYSNKSSKCRKLHNLSESVIIFDEVQMFPYDFLKPSLMAIKELVSHYGTTVLFCSATQPNFCNIIDNLKINDIIENPIELNSIFKRVQIKNLGDLSNKDLSNIINNRKQALTIVNTRLMASKLFDLLESESSYCLTTLITPDDRKNCIEEIKEKLESNQECIVVSTQLIEAGVDIDFPVVYRAISGIDSIIQAAGRCNREGKLDIGEVFIFNPIDDKTKKNGHLAQSISLGELIIKQHEDIISVMAVEDYFNYAFKIKDLDINRIISYFVKNKKECHFRYNYRDAAEKFKIIENNQYPIIIINDKSKDLIRKIKQLEFNEKYFNKLQQYTVMVYEYELKKLLKDKKISKLTNDIYILNDEKLYCKRKGLNIYYDDIFDYNNYIY